MKKKNGLFTMSIWSIVLFLSACNSDKTMSNSFVGKYTVKVNSINLKELEAASEQVKEEVEKGKKELNESLEKAQKEIDGKVEIKIDGKDADLKEVMGKMGEGLGKMMEGIEEMGKNFGDIGKSISENIIKSATFSADFKEDGILVIGSDNNNFNFSSKNLMWKIENGKLIITDKDNKSENSSFDLKAKNDKEWELVNDKISLQLSAKK
jgi:hypothetical protein